MITAGIRRHQLARAGTKEIHVASACPEPAGTLVAVDAHSAQLPSEGQPHRDRVSPISDRDRRMLAFEKQRWKYPGAKVSAILAEFQMSEARYYQVLDHLLDHPAALEVEPQLVSRLRRLRDQRRTQRSARRPLD